MVSALWNACSSGDADAVRDILHGTEPVDLEVKDQFGVTPLIEAVRNGHTDIVKALLEKGADPTNGSAQGLPESYTSDPALIELLRHKASAQDDPSKSFQYPVPPPVPYPYYAEAAPFYNGPEGTGIGNLPPPDIARYIPCRYFPACRYGTSCMFAHPQQYYPGSMPPPAPYVAPYDPNHVQQYPPNYFPPPPFQPNPVHPMSTPSLPGHTHSPSDVPVPLQPPFSPNAIPPAPYGPMSPTAYPHPGHTPVPIMMAPLPPPHPQATPVYTNPPTSYPHHDGSPSYPIKPNGLPQEFDTDAKSPNPQDASGPNNHQGRDGPGHRRGGRHPSLTGRRPPCLFFPAGRCKNGDDCRYPHVTPDSNAPHHMPYFSGRGSRPPRQPNGNGVNNITDKMGGLSVRDDPPAQRNGADRSQSTDTNRPRYHQGSKNGYGQNGARAEKRPTPPPKQQRVPNADEFPVLGGTNTPPTRITGLNGISNGHTGPTAAQVLSAPAPFRKDAASKDSSTRGPSPDSKSPAASNVESNGVITEPVPATTATHDHSAPVKMPISFAAVAAPELPKEIALSA